MKHLLPWFYLALLTLIVHPDATAHDKLTFAPVLKRVTPAVVNISVTADRRVGRNPLFDDPFFRRFFDLPEQAPRQRPSQSVGSGVIIDARKGHVVTNHHVVNGADSITITLRDRRRLAAELVGSDAGTDIALLKVDANNLTQIPVGNSDALEVGDFVVAIGNPFGLGQTVTSGIVSALGRSGLNLEGYEDFIQTDASINPGNSGGALVDLEGNLVGINTAIIAPAGGNVGIGFAVPVNMMAGVIDQLLEYGEVRRGRLGVLIQDVTPDLAQALELSTTTGAVVSQVEEDSPAEAAGIMAGDIIVSLNGRAVNDSTDLRNRIGLMRVGEKIEIEIMRDGKRLMRSAKIGEVTQQKVSGRETSPKLNGAEFRDLSPDHPAHGQVKGVAVTSVAAGSPAWQAGLRQGDVILSVNRQPVRSVKDFIERIGNARGTLALDVLRGDSRLFLIVP